MASLHPQYQQYTHSYTQGRTVETHNNPLPKNKSAFSTHAVHVRELHSTSIGGTQRQRGAAWCKGHKSQHLHEKVKGGAGVNPPVPRHECNRRHRSRRDSPRAMSPPQPLTSHDSRTLQNSLLASASRVNPMGENKKNKAFRLGGNK